MICVFFLFCSTILTGPAAPDLPGYVAHYDRAPGIVLIAHNHLDGQHFAGIQEGMLIRYHDGSSRRYYRVERIWQLQAVPSDSLTPTLYDGSRPYSLEWVYEEIFVDSLTLMTCIERDGDPLWGRLFIQARALAPIH